MGQKVALIVPAMVTWSFQKTRPKEGTSQIMNAVKTKGRPSAEAVVSERRPILEAMFAPKSVAVIGASESPGSVGRALIENLRSFGGRVFPLNPKHTTILGQKAFPKIGEVP